MSSLHLPTSTARLPGQTAGPSPTMSSREIAEIVESRHDSVKRAMERLREKDLIRFTPSVETSHEGAGARDVEVYRVNQRDSYIIVAQLSPEFTARLVDRWQELEKAVAFAQLPNFVDPAASARAWAEQYERRDVAEQRLALLEPKAVALDRLTADDEMILISDAAKRLDKPIKTVFAWLRANKWIFRRGGSKRDIGYADKLRAGLLVHKYHAVPQDDGPEVLKEQVHLTPKGLAHLAAVFGREVKK